VTLFRPRGTWLGADAAYSIDLHDGRVLWLWGDTFVDPKADGSRTNGPNFFVRNGCSVQRTPDPVHADMTFYFGPERAGVPASCLHDEDGGERWLWPLHGARLPGGELLLFRMHVHAVKDGFGFALAGWDAVAIDDPTVAPSAWRPRVIANMSAEPRVLMGSSVLVHGEHLYAYAARNDPDRPGDHTMFLARHALSKLAGLPAGALDDPEWWCGDQGFVTRCPAPVALFDDGQVEQSVHYDAERRVFVQVQMAGLFLNDPKTQLVLRTAPAPQGPWSKPVAFHRPVEATRSDAASLVAYAGKAHPAVRAPGEAAWLVTYVVNDLKQMPPSDALYYPRPLKLRVR
jgi:hypothetical protein